MKQASVSSTDQERSIQRWKLHISKTVTPNTSISRPAIKSAIISSVVAQWPVRMITAPAIASKAPKTFSQRAMITGSLPLPSMRLPIKALSTSFKCSANRIPLR